MGCKKHPTAANMLGVRRHRKTKRLRRTSFCTCGRVATTFYPYVNKHEVAPSPEVEKRMTLLAVMREELDIRIAGHIGRVVMMPLSLAQAISDELKRIRR